MTCHASKQLASFTQANSNCFKKTKPHISTNPACDGTHRNQQQQQHAPSYPIIQRIEISSNIAKQQN